MAAPPDLRPGSRLRQRAGGVAVVRRGLAATARLAAGSEIAAWGPRGIHGNSRKARPARPCRTVRKLAGRGLRMPRSGRTAFRRGPRTFLIPSAPAFQKNLSRTGDALFPAQPHTAADGAGAPRLPACHGRHASTLVSKTGRALPRRVLSGNSSTTHPAPAAGRPRALPAAPHGRHARPARRGQSARSDAVQSWHQNRPHNAIAARRPTAPLLRRDALRAHPGAPRWPPRWRWPAVLRRATPRRANRARP